MYFQGIPGIILFIVSVVGLGMLIFGLAMAFSREYRHYKTKKIGIPIVIFGVLIVIMILFLTTSIEPGNIGIDRKGNYYGPGSHLTAEKIEIVSLTGSISMADNLQLQYSLTPEEAMSMNAGKNFPEKLRDELSLDKIYFVQSSEFVRVQVRGSIDGVNLSHLKLVTSFDPPFFI